LATPIWKVVLDKVRRLRSSRKNDRVELEKNGCYLVRFRQTSGTEWGPPHAITVLEVGKPQMIKFRLEDSLLAGKVMWLAQDDIMVLRRLESLWP